MPKARKRSLIVKKYVKTKSIGAEIGVRIGEFSDFLLQNIRLKKLHLIDPWMLYTNGPQINDGFGANKADQNKIDGWYDEVKTKFHNEIKNNQIIIHRLKSQDAVSSFDNEYFDWIYIDGDHTYNGVKLDLELYWPKLKSGGFMTGDDYCENHLWFGVKKAVDEFVKINDLKLIKEDYNQFIIRKP